MLRPAWSLMADDELAEFEQDCRRTLMRAASLKTGGMIVTAYCAFQATAAATDAWVEGAVTWSWLAFASVTAARLWWRLLPPEALPAGRRWSCLVDSLARGELPAWRADAQAWRQRALARLDASSFRFQGRLRLSPNAFGRWCVEWLVCVFGARGVGSARAGDAVRWDKRAGGIARSVAERARRKRAGSRSCPADQGSKAAKVHQRAVGWSAPVQACAIRTAGRSEARGFRGRACGRGKVS